MPLLGASRPIVSKFGEDLAIANLLQPQSVGTYVDVGANHPLKGSNTSYLYMLGWRGLAIDPSPQFAADFKKYRARDIHLTAGVAQTDSNLIYYEFNQPVLPPTTPLQSQRADH
jgi:hypothetical protein